MRLGWSRKGGTIAAMGIVWVSLTNLSPAQSQPPKNKPGADAGQFFKNVTTQTLKSLTPSGAGRWG